ncbi:MAG: hypothetical protein JF602_00160, partial [Gemmatimonadetes bacterium]|nr:hypothetical protein [Gemmatimonadota bacterium]
MPRLSPGLRGRGRHPHHAHRRSQAALSPEPIPRLNPSALSPAVQRTLEDARSQAQRLSHDAIGAEHILLALLRPGGPSEPVLA